MKQMMKKTYETPRMEAIVFEQSDIILTSSGGFFGEEDSLIDSTSSIF